MAKLQAGQKTMEKKMEEGQKKMEEEQSSIRTTLHVLQESIRYVHETLTPTEARTVKASQYQQLLDKMQLGVRSLQEDELAKLGEPDGWGSFDFVWPKEDLDSVREDADAAGTWASADDFDTGSPLPDSASDPVSSKSEHKSKEKVCYEPVRSYVSTCFKDLDVRIVTEGQGLDNGLLFSEKAFTSRKENPEVHGQKVLHITNIHGRTDIAAFEKRGSQRSNVKFAIEMKTPSTMRHAEREVITQLLGLNISNAYHSPPVILSNAVLVHEVFFVEGLDEFPYFGIVRGKCKSLRQALWVVQGLIRRPGCTMHLGRGPSPPSSMEEFTACPS